MMKAKGRAAGWLSIMLLIVGVVAATLGDHVGVFIGGLIAMLSGVVLVVRSADKNVTEADFAGDVKFVLWLLFYIGVIIAATAVLGYVNITPNGGRIILITIGILGLAAIIRTSYRVR